MKYAVIKFSGKQFKVSEGDEIQVPKIDVAKDKKIDLDQVLLLVDNKTTKIGHPRVKNALVRATVLSHKKGPKIRVFKYKAKSRYRKAKGHRDLKSLIKIERIEAP